MDIITLGSGLIAYSELARDICERTLTYQKIKIYERTQSGDCNLFILLPQSHTFVMLWTKLSANIQGEIPLQGDFSAEHMIFGGA